MKKQLTTKFAALAALLIVLTAGVFAQKSGDGTTRESNSVSVAIRDWKIYEICENSVRVQLPTEPVEQMSSKDIGDGTVLTTRITNVSSGNSLYMVTCFEGLPLVAEKMSAEMKKTFFTTVMKDFAAQMETQMRLQGFTMKVALLEVRETTFSFYPAFEQHFTLGPMRGIALMGLYGGRGVWAIAMYPSDEPVRGDRATFFGSLQIISKSAQLLSQPGNEM
jgi:hypothetical protein